MFSGGSHIQAPTYSVQDSHLTLRPYNAKLTELTESVCTSIQGSSVTDECRFETRTALDCVLRNKVHQHGSLMDNLGACRFHINNAKSALGEKGGAIIDAQCSALNLARRSFV